MHDLAALRLYFPSSSRATRTRFWHHLSAPALANHLLTVARRSGVEQVILHHVDSGYLKGQRLSHHHPDVHAMHHPQCLELIDEKGKLARFLKEHADEIKKVRVLMFQGDALKAVPTE